MSDIFPFDSAVAALGPDLIWGVAYGPEGARELNRVSDADSVAEGGFCWLHVNLAHRGTRDWIEQHSGLPPGVRELLLSSDGHQREVVEGDAVGCVIFDFERDFDDGPSERIGPIRLAITERLFLTARLHPVCAADLARQKIRSGIRLAHSGAALDMLVGAICQTTAERTHRVAEELRVGEDAMLEGRPVPASRDLMRMRQRLGRLHRLTDGIHNVFERLEEDDDLPESLRPVTEKLSQRLASIDRDILGTQSQLRLLREEIDTQESQRTNQNLYVLSIMTALLLPATLVTGIFGMNTGDFPLTGPHGTLIATLIAAAAAGLAYALLRWLGFMRNG